MQRFGMKARQPAPFGADCRCRCFYGCSIGFNRKQVSFRRLPAARREQVQEQVREQAREPEPEQVRGQVQERVPAQEQVQVQERVLQAQQRAPELQARLRIRKRGHRPSERFPQPAWPFLPLRLL